MKLEDFLANFSIMTPENIERFPFYSQAMQDQVHILMYEFYGSRQMIFDDDQIEARVQRRTLAIFHDKTYEWQKKHDSMLLTYDVLNNTNISKTIKEIREINKNKEITGVGNDTAVTAKTGTNTTDITTDDSFNSNTVTNINNTITLDLTDTTNSNSDDTSDTSETAFDSSTFHPTKTNTNSGTSLDTTTKTGTTDTTQDDTVDLNGSSNGNTLKTDNIDTTDTTTEHTNTNTKENVNDIDSFDSETNETGYRNVKIHDLIESERSIAVYSLISEISKEISNNVAYLSY